MTRHATSHEKPPVSGGLFVFEGPDGVGKSTLVAAVQRVLDSCTTTPVERYAFPGDVPGTIGCHVYDVHHNPSRFGIARISATSLQILHVAAHLDAIESILLPRISAGAVVLLDRFWWSTWVYGATSGVRLDILTDLLSLERKQWGTVVPTAVFLIHRMTCTETEVTASRVASDRVAAEYDTLASREAAHIPVVPISNNGSIDNAARQIVQAMRQYLPQIFKHNRGSAKHGGPPSTGPVSATASGANREEELQLEFARATIDPGVKTVDERAATNAPVLIWARMAPAKPTAVFDTYWRFAAERQAVFFRRLGQRPWPWTDDPILVSYKFTNAYRASDRVSQYLIRHVIYAGDQSPPEVFFRVLLFKLFNRIETWERLQGTFGELRSDSYRFDDYDHVLSAALDTGERLYSAAYIMPTGGRHIREARKHRMHLRLLEQMMHDCLWERIAHAPRMRSAFDLLRSYPTIGDFLAYQYVTDLNYSTLTSFTEQECVVPGPGARDGIRKCFESLGGLTESEMIKLVADRQDDEFSRLGLTFQTLWGRPLQLIDCQNLFCEVDKYARVRHPEVVGRSGRTRIKQQFRPKAEPVDYWYPPKWGINDRIQSEQPTNPCDADTPHRPTLQRTTIGDA